MDIKQLRYFAAIAETGSFSAAAQKVNIAQSALSLHIQTIEKRYGVTLFVRGPRGVQLTGTGQVLLDHARVILRQFSLAEQELNLEASAPSGSVTLGVASGASRVLLGPLIQDMKINQPKISMRFIEAMTGHLDAWLEETKIQLAVGYKSIDDARTDWDLTQENFFLIAPRGVEFTEAEIPLARLGAFPLILPTDDHSQSRIVAAQSAELGVTLDIKHEVDSLDVILKMVKQGDGFSILTPSAFLRELQGGEIQAIEIVDPPVQRVVCIKFAKHAEEDPLVQAVARQVVQSARRLVSSTDWPQTLSALQQV
jgi:LysR family nitrogen assimilation transcriptional regulator